MKKFVIFSLIILALIAFGVCFMPNQKEKSELKKATKIKTNSEIFTSKTLEEFEKNPNIKPSFVAKKLVDEMNAQSKNPYDKKSDAFTLEKECKGCTSVDFDDDLTMIILTTYDKKGELIARTVIKPPSFVVYDKKDVK